MLGDEFDCFFRCKLRQRHGGTQQEPDVGHGESWQHIDCELLGQSGITGTL